MCCESSLEDKEYVKRMIAADNLKKVSIDDIKPSTSKCIIWIWNVKVK